MKAETRDLGLPADGLAAIAASRAGRVFDKLEPVPGRQRSEAVEIRGQTQLVDKKNGLGPRRDGELGGLWIEVVGSRSTSAKTGVAPAWRMALAVAMKDIEGQITSSPGPIPSATERDATRPCNSTRRRFAHPAVVGHNPLEFSHTRTLAHPA